jgi:CHAT domain-containing protein
LLAVKGNFALRSGDLDVAWALFRRAQAIYAEVLGKQSKETAVLLALMGSYLQHIGDNQAAWEHYQQSLTILSNLPAPEPHRIADLLTKLSAMALVRGDPAAARQYAERAAQLHPAETLAGAELFLVQARAADAAGDPAAAERHLQAAGRTLERLTGTDEYRAAAFLKLGHAYFDRKQYPQALAAYATGRELYQRVFGAESLGVARSLSLEGSVHLDQQRHPDARRCFEQALAIQKAVLVRVLPALADAEALEYLRDGLDQRDMLLYVLGRLPDVTAATAYRYVWDTKGTVGRFLEARQQFAPDERGRSIQGELVRVRAEIAKVTLAAVPGDRAAERRSRLAELTEVKETLERELTRLSSPAYDRLRALQKELDGVNFDLAQQTLAGKPTDQQERGLALLQIKKDLEEKLAPVDESFRRKRVLEEAGFPALLARLPPDVAVVDVVQVGRSRDAWLTYEAFVLRRPKGESGLDGVTWVQLGPASAIDAAIKAWRLNVSGRGGLEKVTPPPVHPDGPPERRLLRLVWEKIEPHLGECKTVLILPDGALTHLPWAALSGKAAGAYLLEDYAIATAPSGPHLYELLTRAAGTEEQLVAVGGVQYSAPVPGADPSSPAAPKADMPERPLWPYLPGTAAEARYLAQAWQRLGRTPLLLDGELATEAAVKAALPRAGYLHLATHGFFAGPRLHSGHGDGAGADSPGEAVSRRLLSRRNPLALSGIVLAGANQPSLDPWGIPLADDGLLTAAELTGMDLGRTELVVLSACETGLGEVAGGEGVFGLQRGFAQAGARTVVASLWKVHDGATRLLMQRFYDNLWQRRQSKLAALREAQLWMLREAAKEADLADVPRSGDGRLAPAYWAAFVLSGDWR